MSGNLSMTGCQCVRLDVISTLGKLKDNEDFNNDTMAYEDVTQVSKIIFASSSHQLIHTIVKQKSES